MNNPVVVITGATGATGRAAAKAFAAQGASLVLLSSNSEKLEALSAELNLPAKRLITRVVDLRILEDVRAVATYVTTKFGRVDILLHLVGGWAGGKILSDTPETELETMLGQHVWTTFHLVRLFTPEMVKHGWGRVIVVSSPVATNPPASMGAYAVAKAAEETMLMVLAQENREHGVTANVIQVRSIDADGQGKGTRPEEIVATMLHLCSDQAAKITGARIPLY